MFSRSVGEAPAEESFWMDWEGGNLKGWGVAVAFASAVLLRLG